MKFLLLVSCLCLTACAAPGVKYYTKVQQTDPKTGAVSNTTKPIYVAGSDFIGDQEIVIAANGAIRHSITTPRNADGTLAMLETPILNKDRTAVLGYSRRPLVASVDTSEPINAWGNFGRKIFSGLNNFAGTIFAGWAGVEAAKAAGAATTTAVQAVTP